ncbi:MAG TPA: DinB family protein [Acidimicrobiales bacterium]|jgi:hypothetical protein|nr:DinB family protein [Acidimicrobiales bacterium]
MDAAERERLIDRYRDGVRAVHDAIVDITDDDLDRTPSDGGWTARMVLHHLADSEMTSAIRLRRLLVEDAADIAAYDEEEFARRLRYDLRDVGPALKAFEAARGTSAQLLSLLDSDDWSRTGSHPEHGSYSVEDWLRIYAAHAHDHADQIRRASAP